MALASLPSQKFMQTVIAVTLASTAYSFALSGGRLVFQALALGVLFAEFLFSIVLFPKARRLSQESLFIWLGFCFLSFFIISINSNNYRIDFFWLTFFRVAALCIIIMVLQWITATIDPVPMLEILGYVLAPLVILAIITSYPLGHRAFPLGIHPNWWGEVLFCSCVCCLAITNKTHHYLILLTTLFLFILVESRGALLASFIAYASYLLANANLINLLRKDRVVAFGGLTIIIGTIVFSTGISSIFIEYVLNNILLINNEYRGINTSFTGRLDGWSEGIDAFLENPIFGSGLDTYSYVHNGYIRIAAEGGILLLIFLLAWIFWATVSAVKCQNRIALSVIIGYGFMIFFSPRYLNLNLASLIFILSLFRWRKFQRYDPNNCSVMK